MDTLPEHIADLIRQGRKIEAIALIREETGVGLKEAKEAVEALIAGEDPLVEPSGDTTGAFEDARSESGWLDVSDPADIPEDVRALARAGETIEAIRLLRARTGLGLKASKELVETIPGASVPSGRTASVVAVAILALLVGMGVALFLFLAGCAPTPATAGPVFAGPMMAPSADDLTGAYVRLHTIQVYDGKDWASSKVNDTLALTQDGDSLAVEFVLLHANAHLCEFHGTAVREGEGFVAREIVEVGAEKEVCSLRITASPDSITLLDDDNVCRQYYCGARGSIDGITFSR